MGCGNSTSQKDVADGRKAEKKDENRPGRVYEENGAAASHAWHEDNDEDAPPPKRPRSAGHKSPNPATLHGNGKTISNVSSNNSQGRVRRQISGTQSPGRPFVLEANPGGKSRGAHHNLTPNTTNNAFLHDSNSMSMNSNRSSKFSFGGGPLHTDHEITSDDALSLKSEGEDDEGDGGGDIQDDSNGLTNSGAKSSKGSLFEKNKDRNLKEGASEEWSKGKTPINSGTPGYINPYLELQEKIKPADKRAGGGGNSRESSKQSTGTASAGSPKGSSGKPYPGLSNLSVLTPRPRDAVLTLKRNYNGGIDHPDIPGLYLPTYEERTHYRLSEISSWNLDQDPEEVQGRGLLLYHPLHCNEPLPVDAFKQTPPKYDTRYFVGSCSTIRKAIDEEKFAEAVALADVLEAQATAQRLAYVNSLFKQVSVKVRDLLLLINDKKKFLHSLREYDVEGMRAAFDLVAMGDNWQPPASLTTSCTSPNAHALNGSNAESLTPLPLLSDAGGGRPAPTHMDGGSATGSQSQLPGQVLVRDSSDGSGSFVSSGDNADSPQQAPQLASSTQIMVHHPTNKVATQIIPAPGSGQTHQSQHQQPPPSQHSTPGSTPPAVPSILFLPKQQQELQEYLQQQQQQQSQHPTSGLHNPPPLPVPPGTKAALDHNAGSSGGSSSQQRLPPSSSEGGSTSVIHLKTSPSSRALLGARKPSSTSLSFERGSASQSMRSAGGKSSTALAPAGYSAWLRSMILFEVHYTLLVTECFLRSRLTADQKKRHGEWVPPPPIPIPDY